ncbi:unnamed protein product [Bursaphelenchus okinawaensis]|uniref:C2 domain-containing protein n=1 Tax=Bursaphelenchus okinawaensis TaxID=465554 RepID=A0A811K3M4_9BILA|nr:unnamed protein product [Bursaphelenchus okinawaensis]CAG9091049.1 unnamed protein product [Bursaphelenchus okinawaensis]
MSAKVTSQRLPVEKWTRPELEDRFHSTYSRNLQLGQKNVALEKELKILNGRLRKTVMNKENVADDYTKELERKNKLLTEKLQSLKHQLLVYTRPSAQTATVNALTSRVTQRPRTANTGGLTEKNAQNQENVETNRPHTTTVTYAQDRNVGNSEHAVLLQGIGEKTLIIKLNKELREERERLEVARYDVDNKKKEKLKNINQSLNNEVEQSRQTIKALEQSASRFRSDAQKYSESNQTSSQVVKQELKQLKDELESLKQTNKQLIDRALSSNVAVTDSSIIELKTQIEQLNSIIQKLENDKIILKKNYSNLEKDYKNLQKQSRRVQNQQPVESFIPKHVEIEKKDKSNVLDKLYDDVVNIVDSHLTVNGIESNYERNEKWQQLYTEMYAELEKTRKMVASEYEINKDLGIENTRLNTDFETLKLQHQKEVDTMIKTITELQLQVQLLENQLRSVAGGDSFTFKGVENLASLNQPEMTFDINRVKVINEKIVDLMCPKSPRYFICVEFYDFEIATTQIFNGNNSTVSFSTTYEFVVSELFIHYIATDGINLELYETSGTSYKKVGDARISLKELLGSKKQHAIKGNAELLDNKSSVIGYLDYYVKLPESLVDALKAQNRRMLANTMIPIDESEAEDMNRLVVHVQRARGLAEALGSESPSTYVAYQVLDFPPQSTNVMSVNSNPEYNHTQVFNLPNTEGVHQYLKESSITLFVVQDPSTIKSKAFNGTLKADIRLFPLARNHRINKSFVLHLTNGEPTEATVEVSIYWEYDYKYHSAEVFQESASKIIKEIDGHDSIQPTITSEKPLELKSIQNTKQDDQKPIEKDSEKLPDANIPRDMGNHIASESSSSSSSDEGIILTAGPPQKLESTESRPEIINPDNSDSEVVVLESPKEGREDGEGRSRQGVDDGVKQGFTDDKLIKQDSKARKDVDNDHRRRDVDIVDRGSSKVKGEQFRGRNLNLKTSEESLQQRETEESLRNDGHRVVTEVFRGRRIESEARTDENQPKPAARPQAAPRTQPRRLDGVDPIELNRRLSLEIKNSRTSDKSDSEDSVQSDGTYVAEEKEPRITELGEEIEVEDESEEESERESRQSEETEKKEAAGPRIVEFTEPLHFSIPPSDTSSFAENSARSLDGKPHRRHVQKNQPTLSLPSGPSNLRIVNVTQNLENPDEIPPGATVELKVLGLRAMERSSLLSSDYDHTMIFIEWNFLDFDREQCQTESSIEIPRNPRQVANFNAIHSYELDWRRIALLKQWMTLSIRMKFTMVVENNEQEEVEDLGEGYLDLDEVVNVKKQTITLYDVDMIPLALLDIEINYAEALLRHFEQIE